jgi:hypothetical protein
MGGNFEMKFMKDMDTVIELVSDFTGLANRCGQQWHENFINAKAEFASCFNDDGRLEITVDNIDETAYINWEEINDTFVGMMVTESSKDKYTRSDVCYINWIKSIMQTLIKIIPRKSWEENKLEKDITVRKYSTSYGIMLEENCLDFSSPVLSYKAGMKVSKVISKIFTESVLDNATKRPEEQRKKVLDGINIIVSMFIQQIKAEDIKVVLSINPLDFLLVSDHTTGWNSCHLWNNGCHKAGALSYMFDKYSMVSYAYKRKEPFEYADITTEPLGIKMWRSMVHMDLKNRSAIHCRHYPNENRTFARFARKLSAKVLSDYHETPYKWFYTAMKGGKPNSEETCESTNGEQKFRYIKTGLEYTDYVVDVVKLKDGGKPPIIYTGSSVICLNSGEYLNDSGLLHHNEDMCTCYNCNESVSEDDATYIDDEWFCNDCFSNLYSTCWECQEPYQNDDLTYIRNLDRDVCPSCIDEYYYQCSVCDEWEKNDITFVDSVDGYVCNDCLDNDYTYCEDCGAYHENDDVTFVDDISRHVCDDCLGSYRYCEECDEYFLPENTTEQHEGLYICDDCLENKEEN